MRSPAVASRAIAIAAVAVAFAFARDASATPSAKLVYVRSEGASACPDETALRRAVASRIGYDPFFPTATKTVIAQVTRSKAGYRGKVQIVGDDGLVRGERELGTRGDDCSELISAMALAVSIALDDLDDARAAGANGDDASPARASDAPGSDSTSAAAPPSSVASSAAPAAAAGAPNADADAAPATTTAPRRFGVAASVGPVVSVGTAPGPAVGGAVAATVYYTWIAARLDVRADLPAAGDLSGGGRVSTRSVLGTAALCVRGDLPFACAGGGLGSFSTTTTSIAQPASDSALLGEVLAIAGADVALSRQLFVEPYAEIALVLTRHRVFVDGTEGYRLPAAAGTAGIHLGWHFL